MEREYLNDDVEFLKAQLRKENYRYELALKDGAVDCIVKDIIDRIKLLENELGRNIPRSETGNGKQNGYSISEPSYTQNSPGFNQPDPDSRW
jgi:hypothetical protein